jgi:hypothetical protein
MQEVAVRQACQWCDVNLDTPTSTGLWGTDVATLDVGGAARTPGGGYDLANCNSDPGYTVHYEQQLLGIEFDTLGLRSVPIPDDRPFSSKQSLRE